jgi:peptidoglycan/xylan/chitin deacetylase (PgdA/CDA1 family)
MKYRLLAIILMFSFFMPLNVALAIEDNYEDIHEEESTLADRPETIHRVAYLTFDDGPVRGITCSILNILQQEGVPATFFILPKRDVDDIYWRIINEGHELGNHSSSHNYYRLYSSSIEYFVEDVKRAHAFILNNFDYEMTSFRFPGGPFGWPVSVFDERRVHLRNKGYREFVWDVDSNDWRMLVNNGPDLANKVLNLVRNLNDRNHVNILFHDTNKVTVSAVPYVIAGLREMGFSFDIVRNSPRSRAEEEAFLERRIAQRNASILERRLRQLQSILVTESFD